MWLNPKSTLLAMCLAMTGMTAMSDAKAALASRSLAANASGTCQSALPVYDVNIRKRPRAIQNEGDSAAFVTCSYYSQGLDIQSTSNPSSLRVYASVVDGVEDSLTCTLVMGNGDGPSTYIVKTISLAATGELAVIWWDSTDFPNPPPSGLFSISCNLTPGVGIRYSVIRFKEEDL